jgi:4-hydroxybenzoyl-CoA thioesterase
MKFINPKRIRFHHCDSAGIVFYPQYYYLLHETQEDFLSHIQFSLYSMIDQGMGVPIVDMKTQFKGMCRQGDDVTIELSLSKIGGSSLTMEYEIYGANPISGIDRELKVKATGTIVYLDLKTNRPQKIPDDLRTALTPYLENSPNA